ncbi:putative type III restriction endonuclease [Streptococcus pneumoniae]|nr:putative type III restriction endonuclease [Streptococcus pneumoniae]CIR10790.1 putative type III restriction endonuclease [Streptococcus pneumoniae]VKI06088.1 putative type III restriction endonuclease [Streptococcus pneumoniae]VKK54978.1 putative type III restriction endonuclease [Streptococcus pneumoniae]VLW80567.1 putative type III restriction endonuclease [Streptococcus pneumoniae]
MYLRLELFIPNLFESFSKLYPCFLSSQLKSQKIKVSFTQSKIVTPILLVNKTIVWYGAMPLLGKVDEMTILRLESASIVSELVAGLR